MSAKLWFIILMLTGFCAGCVTYGYVKSKSQPNIQVVADDASIIDSSEKQLEQIHSEMNEHFKSPILELQKDASEAYPCKLTWRRAGKENWKIAVIEKNPVVNE